MKKYLKIREVNSAGIGAKIGLRSGDIIIRYGALLIRSNEELSNAVLKTPEGEVRLTIIRKLECIDFNIEKGKLGIVCDEALAVHEKDLIALIDEIETSGKTPESNHPDRLLLSSADTIPGKQITEVKGMARAGIVLSKNAIADFGAGLKSIVGGELKAYTAMMRDAREVALHRLQEDAAEMGANAIVGLRFSSATIDIGAAEVFVYGTAVVIENISSQKLESSNL